jgi:hypothetical protein
VDDASIRTQCLKDSKGHVLTSKDIFKEIDKTIPKSPLGQEDSNAGFPR